MVTATLIGLMPSLPGVADAATAGTWAPSGYLLMGRNDGQTATLLSSGQVLVAGGETDSGSLSEAELYHPQSGAWTVTGPMVAARTLHTAVVLPTGQVLVAGGFSVRFTGATLASAEVYNPQTGTWALTGSMSTARVYQTMTLLPTGKVLVAGGCGNPCITPPLASAELYDPQTGTWTPTGSMTTARFYHTATLLPNGQVLVAGGADASFRDMSSAEVYDPDTGTWTAIAPMNQARGGATATLLPDGRVLVVGGCGCFSAELYNPSTGTWSLTGSMSTDRESNTATLLRTGQVLVAGGTVCDPYCFTLDSAELYDPGTGTWSPTGAMTEQRSGQTATLLPDGTVLAVSLTSTDRYTPGAPAQLAVQSSAVHVGQTLVVTGSRFAASEAVALSLAGTPLTTTLGAYTGTFAVRFTVPASTKGAHTLSAVGLASGLVATATLQVVPGLALSAYSGAPGTTATAVGTGFGASEPVVLHWNTPTGPTLGTTTSSSTGSFYGATKITFRVPAGYRGWHRFYGVGMRSGAVAATLFYEQ
jgi:WD40 repeat protein